MSTVRITCPHCGFYKDVPVEKLPQREVGATCPKCRQVFPFILGQAKHLNPEPQQAVSIAELPIQQGGTNSRTILLLFVFVIVLLVGVRLWADGKKRNVPFPNFIATSTQGVAVSWGKEIYFLDHAGKVLRKQSLPQDVILTQLKFVDDELWIANYAAKTIQRFRNNALETVIDGGGLFRGTFKFAVDSQQGQIFVTDASNHKVHTFSIDGKHLESFGFEDKGPAGLMFPNTIVFDENSDLLIANTNAHRLDVFARGGEFIRSFAKVEAIGDYRYPTLLAQVGDSVAFLLTIDLREAKVVMYGKEGRFIGELIPPKPIHEAGDVAAWNGKILVTDNKERKLYKFSAESLAYEGPFSVELDVLGAEALRLESHYAVIANSALYLLLVMSMAVLFLYMHIRRKEQKNIEKTDYSHFVSSQALWTCAVDRNKMAVGMLLLALSLLCLMFGNAIKLQHPLLALAFYLSHTFLAVKGAILFAIDGGYANPARKDNLVRLLKVISRKAPGLIAPGEQVEASTAVRLKPFKNQTALLLFTNRRIIICDLSLTRSGIRQFGYGDVAAMSLRPVNPSSRLQHWLFPIKNFSLSLQLRDGAGETSVQFTGSDRQLLERIQKYLAAKADRAPIGYTVLCDTCFLPAGAERCTCFKETNINNWKPLVLSLVFPGLGQFYNRELLAGTFNSALFSAGIIMLTQPVIKMVERSAEFTTTHVNIIAQNIAALVFLYVISAIDADQVGRKGRKLFSEATGNALREWLGKKVSLVAPLRRKVMVEFVPGVAHVMAGKYLRAALFFIPLVYLLWTVCWSLLLVISRHSDSFDYVIIEYGSAFTGALWVTMAIDGIRQLNPQRQSLRITAKGFLITIAVPCITLAAGFLAQILREKVVKAEPALRDAVTQFFRQLQMLKGSTRSGYSAYSASMFLGWGGAMMAMFGVVSWQLTEDRFSNVKAAVTGFFGGMIIWIVCATLLSGVGGSFLLLPLLFGAGTGFFIYFYFRNQRVSPLSIPAIMSGAVIGATSLTFFSPVFMSVRPLLGDGTTRILLVALPAYFMHLSYLVLEKAMSVSEQVLKK